ncbi:MAG: hypothetical protein H7039_17075 [Bryobacteraceae bacterium]|nr:hypothetical protein [Bryobacteraceae bacterium]
MPVQQLTNTKPRTGVPIHTTLWDNHVARRRTRNTRLKDDIMASPEQITEEGKQTVLPWESKEAFEALHDSLVEGYNPQGEQELVLTHLVAVTSWRYQRLLGIEAAFMASVAPAGTEHLAGPEQIVFDLFLDPVGQKRLGLVLRYVANASREWRYALAELRKVQKQRQSSGATPPVYIDESECETNAVQTSYLSRTQRRANERAERKAERRAGRKTTGIGFVSQSQPGTSKNQFDHAA